MIQITPQMRILAAVEAVDFRKGIDGLAALCRDKLAADPFSGWMFVFRSRSLTSIKVLVYDVDDKDSRDWRQANGALRDMVCRSLLLALERAGQIELPPARRQTRNYLVQRERPAAVAADARPVLGPLSALRAAIELHPVRRTPQEALFNSLIEQHHYLGYQQPVGEQMKYLATANEQVIACLALSSSPRHLGCRDRFIGWDQETRRRNIHLLAYNTRFLILPWARVPHLASHLLSRMAARISRDWEQMYAHPVHLVETFVDPQRFSGTCYRAANWVLVGHTTGRGKNDLAHKPNRPSKQVLVYPLHRRFRELLQGV